MYFDISDLEIIKKSSKKSNTQKDYSGRKEFKAKAISSEINVIGQNVDEACLEIDKYLEIVKAKRKEFAFYNSHIISKEKKIVTIDDLIRRYNILMEKIGLFLI